MPKYQFNFTIHGTMDLEAESAEAAYDLIRFGFLELGNPTTNLPTEKLQKNASFVTINEVEPEAIEEE